MALGVCDSALARILPLASCSLFTLSHAPLRQEKERAARVSRPVGGLARAVHIAALVESTVKNVFYNYIEIDHDLDAASFAQPLRLGYGHYQWALVIPRRDTLTVDVRLDMRTLGFGDDHISSYTSDSTATLDQFQAWFPSQRK